MDDKKKKPDKNEEEEIENFLKKLSKLPLEEDDPVSKNLNIQTVVSFLSEYLHPFLVVGYDVNETPVAFSQIRSQKDKDALEKTLNNVIFTMSHGNRGPDDDIGNMV